jgi:predicted enzyme related to lactoylglutathione lyase
MSAAPKINFIVIYVSDLDAAYNHFTNTLGLESEPDQHGPVFRQLKGNQGVGLGLNLASDETPPAGTVELYFESDDLQALHTTLVGRGAATSEVMRRPFGSIFNVTAPDDLKVVMLGQ